MGSKQLLKKGFYVVDLDSKTILGGRWFTLDEAVEQWKEIRQDVTGPVKPVIIYIPFDNFAWGE